MFSLASVTLLLSVGFAPGQFPLGDNDCDEADLTKGPCKTLGFDDLGGDGECGECEDYTMQGLGGSCQGTAPASGNSCKDCQCWPSAATWGYGTRDATTVEIIFCMTRPSNISSTPCLYCLTSTAFDFSACLPACAVCAALDCLEVCEWDGGGPQVDNTKIDCCLDI